MRLLPHADMKQVGYRIRISLGGKKKEREKEREKEKKINIIRANHQSLLYPLTSSMYQYFNARH